MRIYSCLVADHCRPTPRIKLEGERLRVEDRSKVGVSGEDGGWGQGKAEKLSRRCQGALSLHSGSAFPLQNDIFEWARDHRVHHKYSETDADPHNARRGFFFSHIGWLFVRKHQDVIEKGRKLDFTDLLDDPVVRFQRK